ncbi:hypothetical protein M9979_05045 [Sphingomonas sp. RP10(2022)]|uniref:Secreted protein n=1 Tax=Sphingomonas liriopis TaxID=2949094 RepID=A0A9X2HQX8_9SPHN|nr:hypothetical protein [Sphingomonas liriopis]MCP3734242.1 hypothetical protein [Sphingomonas liriopis]
MTGNRIRLALAITVAASGLSTATPAFARGCNGVVEFWTWGCAYWDNNNGPNFKYYKKQAVPVAIPKSGIAVKVKDGQAYANVNGQDKPIVNGVSGLVAAGGGNLVAAGGGNLVAAGGGNLQVWNSN